MMVIETEKCPRVYFSILLLVYCFWMYLDGKFMGIICNLWFLHWPYSQDPVLSIPPPEPST